MALGQGNDLFAATPCTKVGEANGTVLALIADRRITRSELNQWVRDRVYPDLHRELIAYALRENGL